MKPSVSVLLPAYNAGPFVEGTVRSVQGQTFAGWEIVACDDCSSDETVVRLEALSRADDRIRVFRNDRNRGVTGNWNECLRRATGTLVMKIDADDAFRPRTLEELVEALEDPAVVGAGVRTLTCGEDLEPIGGFPADDAMRGAGIDPFSDHVKPCADWYAVASHGHQLWAGDGVMLRRERLEEMGGLDERFGCASDTDLIARVLEGPGKFAHRRYVGVLYRTVESSVSHESRRNNWLYWEGTVTSLVSLARYRRENEVPRGLRMRYADLWRRWHGPGASDRRGRELPGEMLEKLEDVMREVPPPPLKDRLLRRARVAISRVPV